MADAASTTLKPIKKPDDPSGTSPAYDAMAPVWRKVDSVLGGTRAMRGAGRELMPQHAEETDDAYQERLETSVLLNYTSLTLESWVGRPFSDPVEPNDDVPAVVQTILPDVDTLGTGLHSFCRDWFHSGVAKAFAHVLVDFPRTEQPEDRPRTLADDYREGVRPYWCLVQPEDLLYVRTAIVGGREVVTHARIREVDVIPVGFSEVHVERIRVLDPGIVTLWEKRRASKSGKITWVEVARWETGIKDQVPLVTFYSDRQGVMIGKPPIEDLVDLNVRHWQSTSDQISILTVSRFPMLALSGGINEDQELVIGPNQWLYTPDPSGRFYYVEHAGAAISAGRQDLADLEEQMALYGAEFLRRRPGNPTATARALDSAESTSPLQDMVLRFTDSVARALDFTAQWMGAGEVGGTVTIANEWGPESLKGEDLVALVETFKLGAISKEVLLAEFKRRAILSDKFNVEEDAKRLIGRIPPFLQGPAKPGPGSGAQ